MVELSWSAATVPNSRPTRMKTLAPPITSEALTPDSTFVPCASTASLFLYAEGSAIVCLHHDTLAVERRFESHTDKIGFISVDNVSERGAGRLVVSYDVSQTAIVWDLFTGSVIARFASFDELKVAAWMRNGNVAFGSVKGDVVLFEPSTSEHISCRTIFDPITALAPSSDCRTYAIGYQNGSILIATLHPTFTIVHTMSTSRGPSRIVSLAWHASSSKQKSDMLATLSANGDLRVWSVAKPAGKDAPRVIRVLKRSDTSSSSEPKWMAWSKNGRIVQYLDGETWAWDVRTKHITSEPVPTIDNPCGFANYGPTATLFTLGPHHTVQQYDLESPGLVANVQHLPGGALPPSGETRTRGASARVLQDPPEMKESGSMYGTRRAPFDPSGIEVVRQHRAEINSPVSSRSHADSVSSKASSGKYRMAPFSSPSRSGHTATSFSLTSASGRDTPQASGASYAYASSVSMSSVKSSRVGSRLRNEVHPSPADKSIDLFPFTRERLNDVPYSRQQPLDESHLTPDDLRRQMLSVVFGWEGDIDGLINDELSRHTPGTQSAILLAQWLGDSDTDQMVSMLSAGPASTADWMLLAFSQMSGESQANKVGQAFVQKLLETGDVHTAATILLGLGDKNDAIEVYVSQSYYMEAILMACLVTPTDWQRQSYLVRCWGEHVVSHSQQQLAIRCFMCTGVEPSGPWTSPAAQQATSFAEMMSGKSPVTSPEPPYPNPASLLPPSSQTKPCNTRQVKTPALKLITSFDSQPSQRFRFPGLKSDDRTPTNAPGVTPIAESAVADSALSPGGFGSYKLNNIQSLNNAMNSRTGTPAFGRGRLPSIGETPVDVQPPTFPSSGSKKLVDYGSTSENDDQEDQPGDEKNEQVGLLPSATYDPDDAFKPSPQTAVQASADKFAGIKGIPSPAVGLFEALKERSDSRNGSRDRMPDGLQLHLQAAEYSGTDAAEQWDNGNFRSPASTLNSFSSAKSPSVSGRSIEQYISSLDEANYHSKKHHKYLSNGVGRRTTDETASQTSEKRHHSRNTSQQARGRHDKRYIPPAKRSPSSPVSMSHEEVARYHAAQENNDDARQTKRRSKTRSASRVRKPRSRNSSERRNNRSSSRHTANRVGTEKHDRGRSADRKGSYDRSPSPPLPTSTTDDAFRLVASDRERRSQQRSSSRRPEKGKSELRARSRSRHEPEFKMGMEHEQYDMGTNPQGLVVEIVPQTDQDMSTEESRAIHSATVPPAVPQIGLSEHRKKELAAAELEARRLSLARNPSAPNIPFPGELQHSRTIPESPPFSVNSFGPRTPGRRRASSSKASPEYRSSSDSNSSQSGPSGLATTPKAMRHPKYNQETAPSVPNIPDSTFLLSDARYQADAERIGRSMSVPVPEIKQPGTVPSDLPMHPRFNPRLPRSRSTSRTRNMGHRRESSREQGGYSYGGSPVDISIEEGIENAMELKYYETPPMLPELQHLNALPPPPPPAPVMDCVSPRESSGTIDIAIDNENMGKLLPRAMTAGPAVSMETQPTLDRRRMSFEHRRGKSVNESFSSKIRNLARMGSVSRAPDSWAEAHFPYESIPVADNRI